MSASSGFIKRSVYHGWVPQTPVIHRKFLEHHFSNTPTDGDYSKPVQDFLKVFTDKGTTNEVTQLFNKAVEQAEQYQKWEDPIYYVKSFKDFLDKIDVIVREPPKFYKAVMDNHITIGEPIGVPILVIFDLIGNTSAAYTLLNRQDFNEALEKLLNGWKAYLDGPGSNATLNDSEHGWFSDAGLQVLQSGLGKLSFTQTYITDSATLPYYNTWDSFFTRQFQNGVRPTPPQPISPDGPAFYLYNPCESTVFRTAENVRLRDTFWLKSQKYSLYDILGGDNHPELSKYAKEFEAKEGQEGPSVLQSFLSPQDFHRWQSPIKGRVVTSDRIAGTYYAVLPDEGAPEDDPDLLPGDPHGTLIRSQPWLSVAATRAVFIIKPDPNSHIDLIAFVAVGMAEVSSCDITIEKKKEVDVDVGSQLGTFHFGGSTYVMVVKPEAGYKVVFQDIFNTPVRPGQHRWIRSVVAQIWDKKKL